MASVARQGRRVAVIGATGMVGSEVIRVLDERDFPVEGLLPVASERSLGEVVELGDSEHPVETGDVSLRGQDVVFLCLPTEAAADWVRRALTAEVPCVDLSGALAHREEVPVVAAELGSPRDQLVHPLVTGPPGASLAWALALAPIHREAGLARVSVTSLEGVSGAGRDGVRSLEEEVVALFSQGEAPESSAFAGPVAFDLVPELEGASDPHGPDPREEQLGGALARVLGASIPVSITRVRVPIFIGAGATVAIETERDVEPAEVCEWLLKSPGIEMWDPDAIGPTTRDAANRDQVLVGRVRRDATGGSRGLLLWLAADPVRLAATNAVRIAEARFDLH